MQDVLFNVGVFLETEKITYCDHAVYYYRITGDSACRRYDPHYNEVVEQVLSSLDGLIGKADGELKGLYEFKRLWLLLEYVSRYYCHPECALSSAEKRDGIKHLCSDSASIAALKKYDRRLFTFKQNIVLGLLSHRLYGVTLMLYSLKNKKLTARRPQEAS